MARTPEEDELDEESEEELEELSEDLVEQDKGKERPAR